jgi:hypothetical protein
MQGMQLGKSSAAGQQQEQQQRQQHQQHSISSSSSSTAAAAAAAALVCVTLAELWTADLKCVGLQGQPAGCLWGQFVVLVTIN